MQNDHSAFGAHCTQRGGEVGRERKETVMELDLMRWTQRKMTCAQIDAALLQDPTKNKVPWM